MGPLSGYDGLRDVDTFKQDIEGITDTLRLNGVALYQVDPRGVILDPNEWVDATLHEGELAKAVAATGGRAFYSNNGLKQIVDKVVAAGSHYYTISYTPTNTVWNGAFRKIQVEIANQSRNSFTTQSGPADGPFHLEYRSGYFARQPQPAAAAGAAPNGLVTAPPSCYRCSAASAPAKLTPVDRALHFGTVAPFELLFRVHVDPAAATEKIGKSHPKPKDNYLQAAWLHKSYRNDTLQFSVEPNQVQFTKTDGTYVAAVQFLTAVYDENGRLANSLITRADISFNKDQYLAATRNGVSLTQTIAVPVRGEHWLRVGVHDLGSGRVGALEIPVSQIALPPRQSSASTVAAP